MTTHTNGGWIESIPAVDIELLESGIVRVTDKSDFNQDYSVDLHPIHLRLIAEKLGLVRELSASEADNVRTCAELRRRLLSLKARVNHLGEYLAERHAELTAGERDRTQAERNRTLDLTYETTFARATADICEAYCADFPSGNAASVSNALVTAESRAVTQESRGTTAAPTPEQMELAA